MSDSVQVVLVHRGLRKYCKSQIFFCFDRENPNPNIFSYKGAAEKWRLFMCVKNIESLP